MKRLLALVLLALAVGTASGAQFARPYVGGGVTDFPPSLGGTIMGMYLVDPVTGAPVTPAGGVSGGSIGLSTFGTIGTTSATVASAGQFPHWLTIQNTSTAATLYVSFMAMTTAVNGFAIAPGGALTLPTGTASALTGLASAAATTFAIIGY